MNKEHTPTPWRRMSKSNTLIVSDSGKVGMIITVVGDHDQDVANAAFIVRAVNSHDALVEALRALIPIAQTVSQSATHDGLTNADALANARAALKLAEVTA